MGGLTTAARHDPLAYTAAARAKFLDSFGVDIPADLAPAERERRITAARRAHMARLAAKSAAARRKKKKTAGASGTPPAVRPGQADDRASAA